jgi:hypothetical protein
MDMASQALDPYIEKMGMSVEIMNMAAQAVDPYIENLNQATTETEDLTQATTDWDAELKVLQGYISGKLGPEIESFKQKNEDLRQKIIELTATITELEAKEYLTAEQQAELEAARAELAETQGAVTALADTHDEATKRILFDLAAQAMAVNGLSEVEFGFLNELMGLWGLADQATVEHGRIMNEVMAAIASGEINSVQDAVALYISLLNAIPGYVYTNVHTHYSNSGSPGPGPPQDMPPHPNDPGPSPAPSPGPSPSPKPEDHNLPQFGFAQGGAFVVGGSPGVDQNLVAFRASRGEMVTITPQHQAMVGIPDRTFRNRRRRGGMAQTNIVNYRYGDNIFVQDSETIAMLYWQRRQEEYDKLAESL